MKEQETSEYICSYFATESKYKITDPKDKLNAELMERVEKLERALLAIIDHQEVKLGSLCNNSQIKAICENALKAN
jgi:hypothetical protein